MLKKINYSYLLFIVLLTTNACKKETLHSGPIPEMPAYTETGANTMAYRVNGRLVIAKSDLNDGKGVQGNRFELTYPDKGHIFFCDGQFIRENYYETIFLSIEHVSDTGIYELRLGSEEDFNVGQYRVGRNSSAYKSFSTTNMHRGKIHITKLDTVNKIISGKFDFQAAYFWGIETVSITDGQFDIKYYL